MRPIPNPPNVHPRAQPDMLQTRQRLNLALVVNVFASVSHTSKLRTLTIVQDHPIAKPKFDNFIPNLFTLNSPRQSKAPVGSSRPIRYATVCIAMRTGERPDSRIRLLAPLRKRGKIPYIKGPDAR
jgi:hypothetical protein